MGVDKVAWHGESVGEVCKRYAHRALSLALTALRLTLYAVLAVLRPFIVAILSAATIGGLALCGFFALLVPGSNFPMGLVLSMSIGCAVLIVVFYAVMDLLLPR